MLGFHLWVRRRSSCFAQGDRPLLTIWYRRSFSYHMCACPLHLYAASSPYIHVPFHASRPSIHPHRYAPGRTATVSLSLLGTVHITPLSLFPTCPIMVCAVRPFVLCPSHVRVPAIFSATRCIRDCRPRIALAPHPGWRRRSCGASLNTVVTAAPLSSLWAVAVVVASSSLNRWSRLTSIAYDATSKSGKGSRAAHAAATWAGWLPVRAYGSRRWPRGPRADDRTAISPPSPASRLSPLSGRPTRTHTHHHPHPIFSLSHFTDFPHRTSVLTPRMYA